MKKKILALVLCLILCLPLVLTACGNNFVESIASEKEEDKASFSVANSYTYKGDISSFTGKFAYTTKTDDDYDITYRVYNAINGEELYKKTISAEDRAEKSVSISLADESLFYVAETTVDSAYSSTTVYDLYNDAGTAVLEDLESAPRFLSNFDKEAVICDDSLYFYENGALTSVKSFYENKMADVVAELTPAGDNYVLVKDNKIFVFNSNFEQIAVQTMKENSKNYYTGESVNSWILNNGNVLVQVTSVVGEYKDVYDDNYDFVVDGICLILDTYLYNTEKLSYKSIDVDYLISDVKTAKAQIEETDYGFFDNAENRALAYKIEDEMVVHDENENDDGKVTLLLSNKGKVEELDIVDGGTSYDVVSDTRYIVYGDYFTRLYDEKNNVIGELGEVTSFNKNFIVTNKAIYKTNALEEVVKFDDDNDETTIRLVGLTVDTVVYSVTEDDETVYNLVTADGSTSEIATNDADVYSKGGESVDVSVNKYFIAIKKTEYKKNDYDMYEESSRYCTIYTTAGVEIDEFEAEKDEDWKCRGAWEDEYAIYTITIDEKSSFVVIGR